MREESDIKAEIKTGIVVYPLTNCPKCDGDQVERYHHHADSMPECFFFRCEYCEHEWGHA